MNVCCGNTDNNTNLRDKPFQEILLNLDKTKYKFYEREGDFFIIDSTDENNPLGQQKKEMNDLQSKIETKRKEIDDYKIKIGELSKKIANMETIILMDEKEHQYIELIGEKKDF